MGGTKNEAQCSRKPYGLEGCTHLQENGQACLETAINSRKAIRFRLASWHFLISCALSFLHFLIKACAPSPAPSISHGPGHLGRKFPPQLPALRQTTEDLANRKTAFTSGSKAKIERKLLGSHHEETIPKGKSRVLSYNSKKLEAIHID